jgi:glucose/mannose transport system permease protein
MSARQVHGIVRAKSPLNTFLRLLLFAILGLFALYYLMPLFVMIATALKPLEEIRTGTLISLPQEPTLEPTLRAWDSACVGVRCEGLKPYVWNSIAMVVPAVIISTFLGAINGYALTKWRFRGSDLIFGLMLFGAFIPFQVVLLPMARTLGILGMAGFGSRPRAGPHRLRAGLHDAVLPQLLHRRLGRHRAGGQDRRCRLLRHLLPPHAADGAAGDRGHRDLAVHPDLERLPLRRRLHRRRQNPVTVALNNLVASSTGVKEYNVDMAAAIIAAVPTLIVYVFAGKYFIRGLAAGAVKG